MPSQGKGAIHVCAENIGPEVTIEGLGTIFEIFQNSTKLYGNKNALGWRPIDKKTGEAKPFQWMSYNQAYERAVNFGAGIKVLNLCPPNDSDGLVALGFYSKNCPEYILGDMGCYSQKITPLPMYDSLGPEAVEYCVNQAELKTLLVHSLVFENALRVAENGTLKNLIVIDGHECERFEQMCEQGKAIGCKIYSMKEIEEIGKNKPQPLNLPGNQDVAFFCYTSGTTGDPKGGLITHGGLISCLTGVRHYGLDMQPTDVHLCYLPLPHVFERGVLLSVIYGGGAVGFFQGDTLKILDDIAALRPTVFPSVPRLLNRIYDKLQAGVAEAGGVKAWLFEKALAAKVENLRHGQIEHALWDRLVFKGVKAKIGFDRIRMIMTGSAPIAGHVLDFLRAVFGCQVYEGYGQTESSLCISFTTKGDYSTGHVGIPAPCNEVRLEDVPDMGYFCTDSKHNDGTPCDGRGEIVFRGPNVFRGYYRMEEKTKETIDKDGWVHTGDIGLFTKDGKLRIIDRKKNIFKLAQGEYVAIEKVENVIQRSPLIAQVFGYGDSLQNCLVAVLVPDQEYLETKGLKIDDPKTKQLMFEDMVKECKTAKLAGFEIPKAIHVEHVPFEIEKPATADMPARTKLLTPTFKMMRPKAKDYYKDSTGIIDKLYEEINSKAKL